MARTLALALAASFLARESVGSADACGGEDEVAGSFSLLQTANTARRAFAGTRALEAKDNASVAQFTQSLKDVRKLRMASAPDDEKVNNMVMTDMNGKLCGFCNDPLPERVDRVYSKRTDCGNSSIFEHLDSWFTPVVTYNKPGTNAWCELNEQEVCADALSNKDFLYQAKAVDYPRGVMYDPLYCNYNGWLAPELKALQHDFEGMKAKSEEVCNSEKYKHTGWNTSLTMFDFLVHFQPGYDRQYPTEEEAIFIGGWTCAMGTAGCDIAYCAYSFCDKGDGKFGMYEECDGWDPVKGMPVEGSA